MAQPQATGFCSVKGVYLKGRYSAVLICSATHPYSRRDTESMVANFAMVLAVSLLFVLRSAEEFS